MRNFKKTAMLALAGAATIAASLTATSGSPAMAASTPIGACGGGSYHVIDHHAVSDAVIYLLYNGTTNCVVTWKNHPGDSRYVWAFLERESDYATVRDPVSGTTIYSTYAGPVKLNAAGTCIIWGGGYGTTSWDSFTATGKWTHCG